MQEIHDGLDLAADEDDSFGIFSVKFSTDGREVVAGSSDDAIYVYDLEANKLSLRISAHEVWLCLWYRCLSQISSYWSSFLLKLMLLLPLEWHFRFCLTIMMLIHILLGLVLVVTVLFFMEIQYFFIIQKHIHQFRNSHIFASLRIREILIVYFLLINWNNFLLQSDVNSVCFADESGHLIYSGSDDNLCKVILILSCFWKDDYRRYLLN